MLWKILDSMSKEKESLKVGCKCKDGKPCDESQLNATELDILNRMRSENEMLKAQTRGLTFQNTQLNAQVRSYLESISALQREASQQRMRIQDLEKDVMGLSSELEELKLAGLAD